MFAFRSKKPVKPLGKEFHFGVATADHQCEAASNEFPKDIRDLWEARPGVTPRGKATDFWNLYGTDVANAAQMGCTAFRLSLSWARIEPQPGVFDDAVIAHYRDVLGAIRAAGMIALATLHHNTWPIHVERRGGMLAPEFPAWFEAYARTVAERLGDLIAYYITINEPNQLVYGFVKPWWAREYPMPPGLKLGASTDEQMDAAAALIRNLFLANQRAYDAIHAAYDAIHAAHSQGARPLVGTNPFLLGMPGWLQGILDFSATRVRRETFNRAGRRFSERRFLEHGKVDVIVAQFSATSDRAEVCGLTEAYYVAHQVLLQRTGAAFETEHRHGRVAFVRSSTAENVVRRAFPHASLRPTNDFDTAAALLRADGVDAVLGDDVMLRPYADESSGFTLSQTIYDEEPYVAAVAPGNLLLLDAIDAAIVNFKRQRAEATQSPWTQSMRQHVSESTPNVAPDLWRRATLAGADARGAEVPAAQPGTAWPPAPAGSVLRAIQTRGMLTVGIAPGASGLCERDPATGSYRGLEIDLAKFMALQIFGDPAKVTFREVGVQGRLDGVRSKRRILAPLLRVVAAFSTIVTTNWWHLGIMGRLPEFLCPKACVGKQDFVGLDYYWGIPSLGIRRLMHLFNASVQKYSMAPVWPAVLYSIIKRLARQFPGEPIVVVENGCVDAADGFTRDVYLRRHIFEVQRAVAAGCNVVAYVCWSITSNREWGLKFDKNSDFGLYFIDLDNDPDLVRRCTPSVHIYRNIIEARTAQG